MELKWSLFTKDIRPHPQLRVKLQQKIHKIEGHLDHFPPDAVHLKVSLEKHQKKKWFRVALSLKLPSEVLRVRKFGDDPLSSFDQAVKTLLRDIVKVKATHRHDKDLVASQTPVIVPAATNLQKPLSQPPTPPPPAP